MSCFCGAPPPRPPHPTSVKSSITAHHASVVSISALLSQNGSIFHGIGVLIHPTLVLTTHSTIPSAGFLSDAEITFCCDVASLTYVKRKLVPEIFFHTNIELDVTVVSCEIVAPELKSLALDTSKLRRQALRKGRTIFIMGCHAREAEEVALLEGRIAAMEGGSKFVKFQTGEASWMPGSAGFDEFGNFAFIVSKPAKVQDEHHSDTKTATLLWKKPKQCGTTVHAIKEWLVPLWETNRDALFHDLRIHRKSSTAMGDVIYRQKSFTPVSTSATPVSATESSRPIDNVDSKDIMSRHESVSVHPRSENAVREPRSAEGVQPVETKDPHDPSNIKPEDHAGSGQVLREAPESKPEVADQKVHKADQGKGADVQRIIESNAADSNDDEGILSEESRCAGGARGRSRPLPVNRRRQGRPGRVVGDDQIKRRNDEGKRSPNKEKSTETIWVQTEPDHGGLPQDEEDPKVVSRGTSANLIGEGVRNVGMQWEPPEDEGSDDHKRLEVKLRQRINGRERWSLPDIDVEQSVKKRLEMVRSRSAVVGIPAKKTVTRSGSLKVTRRDFDGMSPTAAYTPPRYNNRRLSGGAAGSDTNSATSSRASSAPRGAKNNNSDKEDDSRSGSSTPGARPRSLSAVLYSQPTISYTHKRNLSQRHSIAARRASQNALPRWC